MFHFIGTLTPCSHNFGKWQTEKAPILFVHWSNLIEHLTSANTALSALEKHSRNFFFLLIQAISWTPSPILELLYQSWTPGLYQSLPIFTNRVSRKKEINAITEQKILKPGLNTLYDSFWATLFTRFKNLEFYFELFLISLSQKLYE